MECSVRGTAESYIAKVKVQHKQNPRLFEPKPLEPRTFGIQHFAGQVVYDASDFLGKQISGFCYLTIMLLNRHINSWKESQIKEDEMGGECCMMGEMHTEILQENLKGRNHTTSYSIGTRGSLWG